MGSVRLVKRFRDMTKVLIRADTKKREDVFYHCCANWMLNWVAKDVTTSGRVHWIKPRESLLLKLFRELILLRISIEIQSSCWTHTQVGNISADSTQCLQNSCSFLWRRAKRLEVLYHASQSFVDWTTQILTLLVTLERTLPSWWASLLTCSFQFRVLSG